MSKRYGILLIACGHIGEEHIADIYYRDNINIVAVVDKNMETAAGFARKYGAEHYGTDYHPFLNQEVDIVIIATYTDTHYKILCDCLAAKKHVLCEKPIARDLETGLKFYRLVRQADTKVLIAHILRHNKSYQKIAELIQSGVIGELKVIRMVQNHHAINWERYKRLLRDCTPLVDCGVHYIDVMQWVSQSRVCEVRGMSCKIDADSPGDNYGMMQVKLENGCIGYYEAGWSKNTASCNCKEFVGTKGRITLELAENRINDREEGDRILLYTSETGEYKTINCNGKYKDMYGQLSALIRMIETGCDCEPTIDEVFSAFYVTMEAERAIRENRTKAIDWKEVMTGTERMQRDE